MNAIRSTGSDRRSRKERHVTFHTLLAHLWVGEAAWGSGGVAITVQRAGGVGTPLLLLAEHGEELVPVQTGVLAQTRALGLAGDEGRTRVAVQPVRVTAALLLLLGVGIRNNTTKCEEK